MARAAREVSVKYFRLLLLMPLLAHGQDDIWDDEAWETEEEASNWSGFIETGLGSRFDEDPLLSTRSTLQELRGRVEAEWQPGKATVGFKGDAGYDGIEDTIVGDIRELTVAFTVGGSTDVKIGRQIQTWGTGDLVFLNDLFPKDFVSFFAGRDNEYLKAPGDAIRVSHYSEAVNVELVWTPVFEPDVYLTGERFSFFSPVAGENVAPKPPLSAARPRESLGNGEFALRIFRNIEGREYALYAYRGYFKQPSALTETLVPTFAPMNAIGASLRRQAGPGLLNVETTWYMSRDDSDGSNPRIPNDQFRFLSGYEWEPWPNFNVGLQYYLELTLDHDDLVDNSPLPAVEADEYRHVLTNRLTYRMGRDRYTWSLFTFYSPSDDDFYLRPAFTWRYSDHWSFMAGANIFGGEDDHTFFNQLQDGSNAWLRLRYNY